MPTCFHCLNEVLVSTSFFCQHTTFPSLDPVAKYSESCVQSQVHMMRPWIPFFLSVVAINSKEPFTFSNNVHRLSRETVRKCLLFGENFIWVTVSWCEASFWCCFQVVVFLTDFCFVCGIMNSTFEILMNETYHTITCACSELLDLQDDARNLPSQLEAKAKIS